MEKCKYFIGQDMWGNTYWESDNGNRFYEYKSLFGEKYFKDQYDNKIIKNSTTFTGREYYEDESGNRMYLDEIENKKTWCGREYLEVTCRK